MCVCPCVELLLFWVSGIASQVSYTHLTTSLSKGRNRGQRVEGEVKVCVCVCVCVRMCVGACACNVYN